MSSSSNALPPESIACTVAKRLGVRYLISVVIPVYNIQDYIGEAIESVLEQSIGYEYTQIILVDDGSTDRSADVCACYRDEFPNNIECISIDHAGVSAARNAGLQAAQGAYINFLDGDDKWSEDVFYQALLFFGAHPDITIAAFRHWRFGARDGAHPLDYKFSSTRVINIFQTPDYPQLSFATALVSATALKGERFDTRLHVAEDFKLMTKLVMDAGSYGVIKDGYYYYRARTMRDSAQDKSTNTLHYYVDVPRYCLQELVEYSKAKFGTVIPYLQCVLMYELQWRLKHPVDAPLTPQEQADYKRIIVELLKEVSDGCIFEHRHCSLDYKFYAYALKYNIPPSACLDGAYTIGTQLYVHPLTSAGESHHLFPLELFPKSFEYSFIEREPGGFRIEGYFKALGFYAQEHVTLSMKLSNGTVCPCRLFPREDKQITTVFDDRIFPKLGFEVHIPWDAQSRVRMRPVFSFQGQRLPTKAGFSRFVGVSQSVKNNYWVLDDAIVRYRAEDPSDQKLIFEPVTAVRVIAYEKALREELKSLEPQAVTDTKAILRTRSTGLRARSKADEHLWLISDRPYSAGDNGEALFKYLVQNPIPGVHPVFVLLKTSPDFERISKIGDVVDMESREYEHALVTADLYITSSGDTPSTISGKDYIWLKDLIHFKYVFLQHGITKDDISGWINKWNKNIKLFVAASPLEAQSLQTPRYGYTDREVKLTGFPRHDELVARSRGHAGSKTIYLMPTWRSNLAMPEDPLTRMRGKNPAFTRSEYFKFYNGLITNERLLASLQKHGYRLRMIMHPSLRSEADEFAQSECVSVERSCNYQEAFLDAALLVTDYSSVAFDVALLGKPVIYAQFDSDSFFDHHSYVRGYYSYEEDGFGPICKTIDEVVDAVINMLENSCAEQPEYLERVQRFFFDPDEKPRCKRVIEELLKL